MKLNNNIQFQNLFNAAHNLEKMNRAPIFFGHYEHEDYTNAKKNKEKLGHFNTKQLNEACEFINLYKENKEARIITIGSEKIWIYKIKGQIKNGKIEFDKFRQKYYDIEIIKHSKIEDVPYILASMKSNPAFCRNTFRMIDEKKYEGNIAAIKFLIGELNDFKIDPLKTLSSVQLETLVVKIFEKNGAFIPAWRGGTLKGVDIFAKFEGNIPDNLLIKKIKEKNINIQVKLQLNDENKVNEKGQSHNKASYNFFDGLKKASADILGDGSIITKLLEKAAGQDATEIGNLGDDSKNEQCHKYASVYDERIKRLIDSVGYTNENHSTNRSPGGQVTASEKILNLYSHEAVLLARLYKADKGNIVIPKYYKIYQDIAQKVKGNVDKILFKQKPKEPLKKSKRFMKGKKG